LKGLNRSFVKWKKYKINEKRLKSDIADEIGYKEEPLSPDQKQISHILNQINDANKIRQHEGYYSLLLKSAQFINSSIRDEFNR
jgi:hypothetical protein